MHAMKQELQNVTELQQEQGDSIALLYYKTGGNEKETSVENRNVTDNIMVEWKQLKQHVASLLKSQNGQGDDENEETDG